MSVQNLRNKFSQNVDSGPASLTSPGTCFGVNKFSGPTKTTNAFNCTNVIPKVNPISVTTTTMLPKPSSFLTNNASSSSFPRQTSVISAPSNSGGNSSSWQKQNSTNGNGTLDTSRQSLPTYTVTNNTGSTTSGGRAVQNIANRWGSVSVKKPPEQCREDIIRNRWNKNVNNNNNTNSNNGVSENSGYKSNVGKYLAQVVSNNLNNEYHSLNNSNNNIYYHNNNNNNNSNNNAIGNDSDKGYYNDEVVATPYVNGIHNSYNNDNDNYFNSNAKGIAKYTVQLNNVAGTSPPPSSINHSRNNSLDSSIPNNNFNGYKNNNNNFICNGYTNGNGKGSNSSDSSIRGEHCFSGSDDEDLKYRTKWEKSEPTKNDSVAYAQNVQKDYNHLQAKYDLLYKEHNETKQLLHEKNEQLFQLRNLSEAMCKEYDQLKTRFDLENSTMQKTMERALEWYKQNRELKRRSSLLMQHVMTVIPDKIPEMMDVADGCLPTEEQDAEIEEFRKTITDLNKEISRLKVDLNSAVLANEQHSTRNNSLEDERIARKKLEREYCELEMKYNQLYHTMTSENMNSDAKGAEIYEEHSNVNQHNQLEEKLKHTQSELHLALQKAEMAEQQLYETTKKVAELERKLSTMDLKPCVSIPQAPPLSTAGIPPPPPPPMPLLSPNGTLKLKMQRHQNNCNSEDDSATNQMASLLGIQRKTGIPQVEGDTIDKIINELKGGRFTLKSTDKQNTIKKEEEEPPVVHEMRNILGTLKRQPARRGSFKQSENDFSNSYS